MEIGDLVRLKEFPSWGICEITKVHMLGTEETYSVERYKTDGITLLSHVTRKQLTVIEETDENR
jgi:hypothetical protein